MAHRQLADIEGEIIHQTEKAWLFSNGEKQAWIPKSVGEWDQDTATMTLPYNIAVDKELV